MDGKLRRQLDKALGEVDEHGTVGPRLVDDGRRLWMRVHRLTGMKLLRSEPDVESLEIACFAMQLPQKQLSLTAGKLGRSNLKQRAEAAAELLVNVLADHADEALLDRVARLLQETPHRQPMLEEARLLADAVNLDDFGIAGLVVMTVQLALQGSGVAQLCEAFEKRDQYGYWDARLKEGFHFPAVRDIARKRLDRVRRTVAELVSELAEDNE